MHPQSHEENYSYPLVRPEPVGFHVRPTPGHHRNCAMRRKLHSPAELTPPCRLYHSHGIRAGERNRRALGVSSARARTGVSLLLD
jgi:hypothetical protein